jgi:CO/xanthine dehydrogenase Mo-binding subunit
MNDISAFRPSRRAVLQGAGALVVSFSILGRSSAQEGEVAGAQAPTEKLPGSLADSPLLDSWIRVDADGSITAFTGKAELGQGAKTALVQVAAEELGVAPGEIELITADTGRTPNEGYTAGSQTMQNSGTAIRNAAAQVREILIGQAAARFALAPAELRAEAGVVIAPDGRRAGYGELVSGELLHVEAQPKSMLRDPSTFTVMGKPLPRVDIPAKVTGGAAYVQDMRLPNMVHGRVVRPPSPGAVLTALNQAPIETMPGVLKVVRDGNFIGVLAEREWQAVKAMRALAKAATWQEKPTLPKPETIIQTLQGLTRETGTVQETHGVSLPAARMFEAAFTRPYQIHGSIGPSCAVGHLDGDALTVWTHTQGVYPDRKAIAEMVGMAPDKVRCVHVEGSGCYGHNGADDAAADAALLARALPGRPVRVQWMREQEHAWEPFGPAMSSRVRAGLDPSGKIVDWSYDVWTNTHSTRPGNAGSLLAAQHLAKPFTPEPAEMEITPSGNGDRNAAPLYAIPNTKILWQFIPDMPLRVSALRALGAYHNVFSIESFMDELAAGTGADPVEFRLRHLEDPRARDVVTLAAEKFGWTAAANLPRGRGRGFAFARYKNHAAYCAVAIEIEVAPDSGRARLVRAVAAVDSGEIVNPDGIRNQIEGGLVQSMSWTLFEQVTFDETRITSVDWSTYPILRMDGVPDQVDVHIIPRPNQPFLGTGEATQGPTPAAIANAIADAVGVRLRDLPFTRERIRTAIGS